MKDIVVRMKSDHIKVKDGEYIQDIIPCTKCDKRTICEHYRFSNVEWCSLGVEEEG